MCTGPEFAVIVAPGTMTTAKSRDTVITSIVTIRDFVFNFIPPNCSSVTLDQQPVIKRGYKNIYKTNHID
jgi:hypothetical protein